MLIQGKKSVLHKSIWQREEGRKEKPKLSGCQLLTVPQIWLSMRFPKPSRSYFQEHQNWRMSGRNLKRPLKDLRKQIHAAMYTGKNCPPDAHLCWGDSSVSTSFSQTLTHRWYSDKLTEMLHKSFPALAFWPWHFSFCSLSCPSS